MSGTARTALDPSFRSYFYISRLSIHATQRTKASTVQNLNKYEGLHMLNPYISGEIRTMSLRSQWIA
jgi:hypothetical protein